MSKYYYSGSLPANSNSFRYTIIIISEMEDRMDLGQNGEVEGSKIEVRRPMKKLF